MSYSLKQTFKKKHTCTGVNHRPQGSVLARRVTFSVGVNIGVSDQLKDTAAVLKWSCTVIVCWSVEACSCCTSTYLSHF